ncbi:hypothetical protein TNIN_351951 [Trichonephila inaurata madagascariensis]|uniref:Uncharacterized protein n=1 Tax=Trichonephila inaurata madagascariensis TaxID=2747483 RepID=A0A8X7BZU6_9ARAC|nr:hypothetical protein TNIN_351951 [Trichonephila inaurata madagascariensis]
MSNQMFCLGTTHRLKIKFMELLSADQMLRHRTRRSTPRQHPCFPLFLPPCLARSWLCPPKPRVSSQFIQPPQFVNPSRSQVPKHHAACPPPRKSKGLFSIVALLCDSIQTSDVCFMHPDVLRFPSREIGLIASGQEIPCSAMVEATDGDSPLQLALLMEATAGVGMSHAQFVEATSVTLLEPSETVNARLIATGLLAGCRGKSQ